jgi:tetratricopeptide (TPR) repeat protein
MSAKLFNVRSGQELRVAARTKRKDSANRRRAQEREAQGLENYQAWNLPEAIADLEAAARLMPNDPDYRLNHAKALARSGDYDRALKALAEFIRVEKDPQLVERYERLFANAMDEVESLLTRRMAAAGLPVEEIGKAIQMWLEYRITIGRQPLVIRRPETWAAALDFTVRRVNLRPISARQVAGHYKISPQTLRARHQVIVQKLDIMPCDYRYFVAEDNPLDKLVEAAELWRQLEAKFQQP